MKRYTKFSLSSNPNHYSLVLSSKKMFPSLSSIVPVFSAVNLGLSIQNNFTEISQTAINFKLLLTCKEGYKSKHFYPD